MVRGRVGRSRASVDRIRFGNADVRGRDQRYVAQDRLRGSVSRSRDARHVVAWSVEIVISMISSPMVLSFVVLSLTIVVSSSNSVAGTQRAASEDGLPTIVLAGKLATIFTVDRCEFISGMTCRVTYNGKGPLPSRVFFTELDEKGKSGGPRIRLLYPRLGPGESGKATFRIRLNRPAKVVLTGEWHGPWQDPY
jgi:hypothetical protein